MSIMHLTSTQTWQLAGWTMLHFLWLGTLVALVAGALRLALIRTAPNVRYVVLLIMLGILAILPAGISTWLAMNQAASSSVAVRPAANGPIAGGATGTITDRLSEATPSAKTNLRSRIRKNSDGLSKIRILANPATAATGNGPPAWPNTRTALPWLATWLPWLWIVGAPLSFGLLATGLIGTERLRHDCQPLATGPIPQTGQRLAHTLGLVRPVAVAVCDRLSGPVLVGIVRPLILLPPAAVCGWSPEQVEMVLLHELAHVRRYDNLVNLLQRTVEGVLFFHPALWLTSHWVRLEREACCDALVVAHTGQPRQYAQLLITLAEMARGNRPALASAMAEPPLAGRIRRILKLEDEKMLVSRRTVAAVALGLLVSMTLVACYRPSNSAAEPAGVGAYARGGPVTAAEDPALKQTSGNQANIEQPKETSAAKQEAKPGRNRHFLSLEDQRHADLAYKMLGLELEPIGQEDLARVRAQGFSGGLRVSASPMAVDGIWTGDLLVGLHVWTTGSLPEIGKLLARDDLAEYVPLKFYVIRGSGGSGGFGGGGYGREGGGVGQPNQLVTGRITVTIDAPPKQDSQTVSDRPAPSKSALLYDGKTFDQWQQQWRTELKPERRTEAIRAMAAFGRSGYGKEAAETILEVAGEYDFHSLGINTPEDQLKQAVIKVLASTSGSHLPETDWLPALQQRFENNPEKWQMITYWLLAALENADPTVRGRLDNLAQHANPYIRYAALTALYNSDPEQNDPLVLAALRRSLASSNEEDIAKTLELMTKPVINHYGGSSFENSQLVFETRYISKLQPEIYALLFRTDIIRTDINGIRVLNFLEPKARQEIVDQLLQIIQDPSRNNRDHQAAIDSLAELGAEAVKAIPALEKLLQHEDPSLSKAAAKAIEKIDASLENSQSPKSRMP